nr:helix-turn-helix transcriptional regulator [uncultured Blautia sp.]
MNIGKQISTIRKERQLTQEQFGSLFHVTRQTVSNWENEKSYPDLQTLIDISNQFEVSLDILIKKDSKMVKTIDKERVLGKIKKEKSIIEFFTGAGTGIIVSCLLSPDSIRRTVVIIIGLVMIGIGWYKKTRYDNKVFTYMGKFEEDSF